MKYATAICLCFALAEPCLAADWIETHDVTNYNLQSGPWVEGYIPTPPRNASYRVNAREIEALAEESYAAAFSVWVWKVRVEGLWDYKQHPPSAEEFTRLEASGNFNYGVTAAALGLPYWVAQFGAGVVQIYSNEKNNYWPSRFRADWGLGPYGVRLQLEWRRVNPFLYGPSASYDEPSDAVSIKAGYDWYLRTRFRRSDGARYQDSDGGSGEVSNISSSTRFDYLSTINTPFWDTLLDRQLERRSDESNDANKFNASDPFDLTDSKSSEVEALPQDDSHSPPPSANEPKTSLPPPD
jgi:hypothetical protein